MATKIMVPHYLKNIRQNTTRFLGCQQSLIQPGYYRYSLSGDLYSEADGWGLGATVYASKIQYILNSNLDSGFVMRWNSFINTFAASFGEYYDRLVLRKSLQGRVKYSIKTFDFNNLFGQQYRRAETRRAWEAFCYLGTRPRVNYLLLPNTQTEIQRYMSALDWGHPWGAASHVNHLLFFLSASAHYFSQSNNDCLDYISSMLSEINSVTDGSWYVGGNISRREKINSAMKICMGLRTARIKGISYPERLIDLCLDEGLSSDACSNINSLYVLSSCLNISRHRKVEAQGFASDALAHFESFYFPVVGGFSFYKGHAADFYYGTRVTKSLPEPDVHGTAMYLWGITIAGEILGITGDLGLRSPLGAWQL